MAWPQSVRKGEKARQLNKLSFRIVRNRKAKSATVANAGMCD